MLLSAVLCGSETWSVAWRERQRVFGRIFGLKVGHCTALTELHAGNYVFGNKNIAPYNTWG